MVKRKTALSGNGWQDKGVCAWTEPNYHHHALRARAGVATHPLPGHMKLPSLQKYGQDSPLPLQLGIKHRRKIYKTTTKQVLLLSFLSPNPTNSLSQPLTMKSYREYQVSDHCTGLLVNIFLGETKGRSPNTGPSEMPQTGAQPSSSLLSHTTFLTEWHAYMYHVLSTWELFHSAC